jgi:hypothetical protein
MIVIAAAMLLAGSDVDLRHTFVACLKTAASEAQHRKIGADGFAAFARTTCAAAQEPFEAALVNANAKHGMSRKDSASDASQQVSDYYKEWTDKYSSDLPPAAQAAAKPSTPAPTPASEPTEPK